MHIQTIIDTIKAHEATQECPLARSAINTVIIGTATEGVSIVISPSLSIEDLSIRVNYLEQTAEVTPQGREFNGWHFVIENDVEAYKLEIKPFNNVLGDTYDLKRALAIASRIVVF